MTNPPRYPTDQPGHGPDPSPSAGQPYPGAQTHVPSHLRYDWRYAQPPTASPYDPYYSAHQPITAPIPTLRPKKSRRGAIVAGAVAAAMVGGGIGAATMLANERANDATTIKAPIAQAPAGPTLQPSSPRARWNRSRPR